MTLIPLILSDTLNNVLNQTKLSEFENQLQSLKINQLKEISNLTCGIWLYNMDRKDIREETLDSTYKSIEKNLGTCSNLY